MRRLTRQTVGRLRWIEPAARAAGILLLLAGHFLPWAAHKTAALTLAARELAVFTNATPGAGIFWNEWFYLPLWAAALLLAASATASRSRLTRLAGAATAAAAASLGLPPYPAVLTAYANPDLRLQFFASLAVMAACLAAAPARFAPMRLALMRLAPMRLAPKRLLPSLAMALAAMAAAVPLAGFLAVKPFIEQLYRDSLGVGLGWWATLAGVLAVLISAVRMLQSARARPKPDPR
jgi:hypothetical protein